MSNGQGLHKGTSRAQAIRRVGVLPDGELMELSCKVLKSGSPEPPTQPKEFCFSSVWLMNAPLVLLGRELWLYEA